MLTRPDGRPNYLAGPLLSILLMGALVLVAAVFFAVYGLLFIWPKERKARIAQEQYVYNNGPAPLAVARARVGDVQIFSSDDLKKLASTHAANVGVDIEGNAKIQGDINGMRISDHRLATIEVDGNIINSFLYMSPGSSLSAQDVSNSRISIPEKGSASLRDISGHSAISSENLTVRNATDGTLITKNLTIRGEASQTVKIAKGQWK